MNTNKQETEQSEKRNTAVLDESIKYQEGGLFWRHCSTLRRTTIGFLFAATAASLGFIKNPLDSYSQTTVLIVIFNIVLCVGVFLQEIQVYGYQRLLGKYLNKKEEVSGPYSTCKAARMRFGTHFVMILACILLTAGWVFILKKQIDCKRDNIPTEQSKTCLQIEGKS